MVCSAALLYSQFWAAVCFCTADFQVCTLHALMVMQGLRLILWERVTYIKDYLGCFSGLLCTVCSFFLQFSFNFRHLTCVSPVIPKLNWIALLLLLDMEIVIALSQLSYSYTSSIILAWYFKGLELMKLNWLAKKRGIASGEENRFYCESTECFHIWNILVRKLMYMPLPVV